MSETGELAGFDAQTTYNAAADDYLIAAGRYWPIASTRLIERLTLRPGGRVLDVACGPGVSAMLAARAVGGPLGADGRVIAVDYGAQMLRIAEAQAKAQGLTNIEFRLADMSRLDYPPASFDALTCALGIFFVEDMVGLLADFWRLVRPGGQIGLGTMGAVVVEPLYTIWKEAYEAVRPQRTVRQPWERANRKEIIERLLADAGVSATASSVEITHTGHRVPLPGPDECWTVVMGSSMRSFVQELSAQEAAHVREQVLARVRAERVDALQTDVILTVATKAG